MRIRIKTGDAIAMVKNDIKNVPLCTLNDLLIQTMERRDVQEIEPLIIQELKDRGII